MTDQPALNELVIDTHGPTITVRSAEPLETVLTVALKAFHEARPHDPGPRVQAEPGPAAVGFAHVERAAGVVYSDACPIDLQGRPA